MNYFKCPKCRSIISEEELNKYPVTFKEMENIKKEFLNTPGPGCTRYFELKKFKTLMIICCIAGGLGFSSSGYALFKNQGNFSYFIVAIFFGLCMIICFSLHGYYGRKQDDLFDNFMKHWIQRVEINR